jgi:biopolymer transport protein ExbB/TolQ
MGFSQLAAFVEYSTMALLIGLSIWSGSIVIERKRFYEKLYGKKSPEKSTEKTIKDLKKIIDSQNEKDLKEWSHEKYGIFSELFQALLSTPSKNPDAIDRSYRSFIATQKLELEKGLTPLATLGSNAPFIGLFGTVLGIIQAFSALSSGDTGSTSVMSGISRALIATAAGLFVAIPAVVAFNIYSRKLKVLLTECEGLKDYYLSRLKESSNGR